MAEPGSDNRDITFTVRASNESKYSITIPSTATVAELKQKLSASDLSNTAPADQRLIYSGRVLKDEDKLVDVKIKDGQTVHLVRSAKSNKQSTPTSATGASSSSSNPTPAAIPTNIAAGTGNNPLAHITGARYAGFHGLPSMDSFGPDGGMAGAGIDQDAMLRQLDDPNFVSQMNEALNNPSFLQIIEQSPMFRDNPMARQLIRDPEMRRMMFNPQMLRAQMQMSRALNGNGGGSSAFPAPGVTDTTPETSNNSNSATPSSPSGQATSPLQPGSHQANPLAALLGGNPGFNPFGNPSGNPTSPPLNPFGDGGSTNPFAALLGQPPAGSESTGNAAQNPGANLQGAGTAQAAQMLADYLRQSQNPNQANAPNSNQPASNDIMRDLLMAQMFGGGGGFSGTGAPPEPADNRPPEERYASQLRQLNDMGFFEFERNIEALRRSGGSVQGAIEYLLNNPNS